MRRCAHVTKCVRWIGMEIIEVPSYGTIGIVDDFVNQMEKILEGQRILALDVTLKGTPA